MHCDLIGVGISEAKKNQPDNSKKIGSERLPPKIYTRTEVNRLNPSLIKVDDEELNYAICLAEKGMLVRAIVVTEMHVSPLLGGTSSPNKPVLVISLSPEFAPDILEMVDQTPDAYNVLSNDLCTAHEVIRWKAPSNSPGSYDLLVHYSKYMGSCHGWAYRDADANEQGFPFWMPIIMISGNRVAVGGYLFTEEGPFAYADNFNPTNFFTHEELTSAAACAQDMGPDLIGIGRVDQGETYVETRDGRNLPFPEGVAYCKVPPVENDEDI